MRSSCITHPAREPLLVIRKSQVDFCQGNVCAAALLSFFDQNCTPGEKHAFSSKELSDGILQLYGHKKITQGINLLVQLGAVEVFQAWSDLSLRYEKTRYFLFNPSVVNAWIESNEDEN